MRIAVVGLGLIGGSIALACRERLGFQVAGYDIDASALLRGRECGIIDVAAASLSEALVDADVAFVAAPVGVLPGLVEQVLAVAPERCVVSDVGSTKRVVSSFCVDQRFVGGHPLAGAETAGIEHARADLFDGAAWYLTPTETTSGILYERLYKLISGLGARPVAIDAAAHDTNLALVSHLPHVLANVLVNQAAATGEQLPATGPSFRDATRVAGSNTAIWADIYRANSDALTGQLTATIEALTHARDVIARGDRAEIAAWNDRAAADRRALQSAASDGPLHELRVSVPNRPGVVAELALALGRAGVNIADMALYPAPDMSDGVVALWITGADNADRAEHTIGSLDLPVYRP